MRQNDDSWGFAGTTNFSGLRSGRWARARPAGGELGDGVGGQEGEERIDVESVTELGVGDVVGKREEKQGEGHEDGKGPHAVAVEEDKAGEAEDGGEERVKFIDARAAHAARSRPEAETAAEAETKEDCGVGAYVLQGLGGFIAGVGDLTLGDVAGQFGLVVHGEERLVEEAGCAGAISHP